MLTNFKGKEFQSNFYGDEVHYTACSLLAILKNSFSKLHYQKGFNLIPCSHKITLPSMKLREAKKKAMKPGAKRNWSQNTRFAVTAHTVYSDQN